MAEHHEQVIESRVGKVGSEERWDLLMSQAKNQGCPVVAHFTASWCIPSVAMKQFFEELALRHQDILFLTVDVDEVRDVALKMEIKAMPTFLLVKEGIAVHKLIGANPDEIKKRVKEFVDHY